MVDPKLKKEEKNKTASNVSSKEQLKSDTGERPRPGLYHHYPPARGRAKTARAPARRLWGKNKERLGWESRWTEKKKNHRFLRCVRVMKGGNRESESVLLSRGGEPKKRDKELAWASVKGTHILTRSRDNGGEE